MNAIASEGNSIVEDTVEFEGHYYKLYKLNMSWEEAEEYFEKSNGHLATITSSEEDIFLYEYITSLGCSSAFFGATDKNTEGTWEWVTGEDFIYNNWHQYEPNDEFENEDYIMYYEKYPDGTWNDGGTKTDNTEPSKINYICEWDNITYNDNAVKKNSIVEININQISIFGGFSILSIGGITIFTYKKFKEKKTNHK